MDSFPITDRNKVKRVPSRGHYDKQTVHEILDQGVIGHVGFSIGEQPFVIPMVYGRHGDDIYLHGATTSRLIKQLEKGVKLCLTVTHLDGIVLARSAFHHSMNYRSAVVYGEASKVEDLDKENALELISEHLLKGRWDSVRKPSKKELKATTVLKMTIEEASAKIRTGPPVDDEEDYQLPIWAGVLPITQVYEALIPDPQMDSGTKPGPELDKFK